MTTDMPHEEFLEAGQEVFRWIADYLENIRDLPVLPRVQPGDISAQLPVSAPETGEPIEDILRDFREIIVPGTTHWNHPGFHAYFATSAARPGILAEALIAGMNANGIVWKSGPALTELELRVLGWLREWLGLPEEFFGCIFDTASTSTLHGLIAARQFVDPESRTRGMRGDLTVYTSEHAHSSVEKGAIAAGFGQNNVRKIPVDAEFRMIPAALEAALKADAAAAKRPCCIVPTVGTTSTTSIDPVREVVALARRYGAWVHVDGAYGGSAGIIPELRDQLLDGVALADSFVLNPHKWMFIPLDCSVFYTRHPEVFRAALSLSPEYLKTAQDGIAVNLGEYGIPLGRRFRALKLWFVMRYFGHHGMAAIIRQHIDWTRELASWIQADPRFEIVAPTPFALVCFRLKGDDQPNRELMDRINATGRAFLSHTVLNGRYVLRLSIGNVQSLRSDVELVWRTIQAEADALVNSSTTLSR